MAGSDANPILFVGWQLGAPGTLQENEVVSKFFETKEAAIASTLETHERVVKTLQERELKGNK